MIPLSRAEAAPFFLEQGLARAVGVTVYRSPLLPRGTLLEQRFGHGQLVSLTMGTHTADPLEVVRRDARRIVREGMTCARVVPQWLQAQHRQQRDAEDLIDQLAGPPAGPA